MSSGYVTKMSDGHEAKISDGHEAKMSDVHDAKMSVIGKGSHGIVLRTSHSVIKLPLSHNSGARPLFRDLYYSIANGYFQEAICYDDRMCLRFIDSGISMLAFIKAGGHHVMSDTDLLQIMYSLFNQLEMHDRMKIFQMDIKPENIVICLSEVPVGTKVRWYDYCTDTIQGGSVVDVINKHTYQVVDARNYRHNLERESICPIDAHKNVMSVRLIDGGLMEFHDTVVGWNYYVNRNKSPKFSLWWQCPSMSLYNNGHWQGSDADTIQMINGAHIYALCLCLIELLQGIPPVVTAFEKHTLENIEECLNNVFKRPFVAYEVSFDLLEFFKEHLCNLMLLDPTFRKDSMYHGYPFAARDLSDIIKYFFILQQNEEKLQKDTKFLKKYMTLKDAIKYCSDEELNKVLENTLRERKFGCIKLSNVTSMDGLMIYKKLKM